MAYGDFTLEAARKSFGLTLQSATLFDMAPPLEVPPWLRETFKMSRHVSLVSEKARSELLVMPVLLTARELCGGRFAILSGQRMDVDVERGLVGECDFILTLSPPVPILLSPVVVLVEAKKADIDAGLGQCAAQMVGAQRFNEKEGTNARLIFGCVTTGKEWRFLKLEEATLALDEESYFIDKAGLILGVFQAIMNHYPPEVAAA